MRFMQYVSAMVLPVLVACSSTVLRSDQAGTGGCERATGSSACASLQGGCDGVYRQWSDGGTLECECCGETEDNPKYK